MKKRKWILILPPARYEVSCNKCGGKNIAWSEFEHKIWCYDCKKDLPGNPGVFDGPIPITTAGFLGMIFWEINLENKKIYKQVSKKDGKLIRRQCNKIEILEFWNRELRNEVDELKEKLKEKK